MNLALRGHVTILKKYHTDYGIIHVTHSKSDGTITYFQNGCFHSQADKKGTSLCAYVHVIQEIVRQQHAKHVLVIGCAGGTLATMLRRLHCRVTAVDINPMAFAIARRHFQLPDDVRCVRRDGITYLRTTKRTYDIVVVDVFGSNNNVPRPFTTELFFQRVKKVLSPQGVVIMNVMTSHDEDSRADTIAHNARSAHIDVTLFDWPGQKDRNTLIVGGKTKYIHIPSGKEPKDIKDDLVGLIRRKPKTRSFT